MPRIGVVLTASRAAADKEERAYESAYSALERIDECGMCVQVPLDRRDGVDYRFGSWLRGVQDVNTDYVAILHDDDWYEPEFLERAAAMMAEDVAYVFTQARIHFPGGGTRLNWGDPPTWGETGHLDSRRVGDALLGSTAVISPSCVLYRRADLLRNILPGGAPGLPHNDKFCGPDLLMCLLPLLDYPKVGWIADPLVNFDGHDESTTIAEMKRDGGKELQVNYDSARLMFHVLRQARDFVDGRPV